VWNSRLNRPRRLKGYWALGVGMIAGTVLVAGGWVRPVSASTAKTPFLLGAAMPLTGSQATYGTALYDAQKLAVAYINKHGGVLGHPVTLLPWDTKADPATGVAGAEYFVNHHVNAVVGFFDSDVTIPAVRILAANHIPLFAGNPSTPELAELHLNNFVRITGDDAYEGMVQALFARHILHAKTAVVLEDEEIFGEAFATAFKQNFVRFGGHVLAYEGVNPNDNNYSSVLAEIKSLHPSLLEFSGFYQTAGLLIKQARAMGIKSTFITDSAVYGSQYLQIAGRAAIGSYMTNLPLAKVSSPLARYLNVQLRKQYHLTADPIDANAFDAVIAVWKAAQLARSIQPTALIGTMHAVHFIGATGAVSFTPAGNRAQLNYTVVRITPRLTYQTVFHYQKTL
jgi:branched-chain amino acid transport system substrate-binding protein